MKKILIITLGLLFVFNPIYSQKRKGKKKKGEIQQLSYNNIEWRNIGPFRGGRSVTS